MQLDDFDYFLPPELIAQYPLSHRSASRLLACPRDLDGHIGHQDLQFTDLPQFLQAGDVLVFNNTKVIPARLYGRKASGGQIEVLIERILNDHQAWTHIKASNAPPAGSMLHFEMGEVHFQADVLGRSGPESSLFHLRFHLPTEITNLYSLLEAYGELPLPPYITHTPDSQDKDRYQTVYASQPGAVAAPTAGLHFDTPLLEQLRKQGIHLAYLTLHVGAGTFQPVRVNTIAEHRMHSEWYHIPEDTAATIAAAKAQGRRVIAVGTTSMRSLEAACLRGQGAVCSGSAETDIFITPGFKFQAVDALITNFHLPKSTLLMLIAAFVGMDAMRAAYAHAIAQHYRFFSYGDAMYLERGPLPSSN
ncbi:tRNA preQ1(34) S-adenosylmethionine ribosyltransferase-isomerase QueA [Parvibium lacunae]|uniref:S-adenosylmethionine:tRNA ribosyltransferase-isomerase n=1 Tax=Parvibium lacunae TaxID=1888893 RepID=A0A368L1X6_9BURK|nr:tRNA preQ1(34) S-adenosylmethionine ribosyltransferase-isomerase QueA [Parvibium lacunae]RCS57441.1 tRNA preQ1(34) S-adenosylmethionine ribosyltransferase-isomerase QueA [Parvibium lacunae]